jgi:ribosomal protein L37E
MNLREIVNAWIISFNPTPEQKKLALDRANICDTCEYKTYVIKKPICSECGCPIGKKIFSQEQNPCPKKKWKEVDSKYFSENKQKSII